jgi:phosphotransferase system HPr (HPr) family protein
MSSDRKKRVSVERLNPMSDKRRNNMITKKIQIQLQNGLEARPVAVLVQVASQYNSSIYVECDDRKVNAKSIMGMMTLGLTAGEEVVVSANGDDEQTAMDDIVKYLSTANA